MVEVFWTHDYTREPLDLHQGMPVEVWQHHDVEESVPKSQEQFGYDE
jgi:hypothetical protein